MKTILPVKGTRDFYPDNMALRSWLYAIFRRVSEAYGYQEWEGPLLETIELYATKSGDELVKEQSYVFTDRGGNLITLRPELTPTLARMIAQRQRQMVYPLRWWSFGPFWRYERPQKGRTREFFQWNVDLIGVESPEADAEIVAIVAELFKEVGLHPDKVRILVNSRRLVEAELDALEIPPANRLAVSRWIDRRDKLAPLAWQTQAAEIGLDESQVTKVKEFLQNYDNWKNSDDLPRFFAAVEALGYRDYVSFDPNIVRGLDYYTGIVFEAVETDGELRRSILGGGRYDNLLAAVGGQPLPATGFAMGDIVFPLLLEKLKLLPDFRNFSQAPVLVTVFEESLLYAAFAIAAELRRSGLNVISYPEAAKLNKQLKYADRSGVRMVVFLGPDEIRNDQITIKDLLIGDQLSIPRATAPETIRSRLARVSPS